MIRIYQGIAAGLWLLFCAVWLVGAIGAKKTVATRPWWLGMPVRFAVLAIILLFFGSSLRRELLTAGAAMLTDSPGLGLLGSVLCTIGIGYAIWARFVIGRNWGMPMTLKEGHELVTSGPYAQVRHPIYSGVLLAMLGSALVISLWWIPVLLVNGVQFIYAARKEEQLMLKTFPRQYPAYMRRTRMLIPYIF
jgi:protein-S-isoprenylcysteine O-methyltransferase Ste14